jgi:hypothetical protein
MKKNKYTIRRKNILNVRLVSLTGQTWYDANDNLIDWEDLTNDQVVNGTVVYNISGGTVNGGYYIFNGTKWTLIDGAKSCDLKVLNNQTPLDRSGNTINNTVLFNDGVTYTQGY